MAFLQVTTVAASILGLELIVLSAAVIRFRGRTKLSLGDGTGGSPGSASAADLAGLQSSVRAHANFAEYVPLALILLALVEFQGGPRGLTIGLAAALVVGRLMHPFGLMSPPPNVMRAGGIMLTFAMILVASVYLLIRQIQ